jgi:hypothetical protein
VTSTSARRRLLAAAFWIGAGLVAWNGVFDLLVSRGVKEYLYRQALHRLAEGPPVSMAAIMEQTVRDAWPVATGWALALTLAGLATIRWTRTPGHP